MIVSDVMNVASPPVPGIDTRSVMTRAGLISSLTSARCSRGARCATMREPVGEYMMSS